MDSGGTVVHVITGTGSESWSDEVWATEDEYPAWNDGDENSADNNSNWNCGQRYSQSQSGSEPMCEKSRNSQDATSSNRSKAIGKMFFMTKLCCKFRAGTCPYITNCNFAHRIEELRRPPPNWQEIVAAHEEETGLATPEPREEFQIPSVGSSDFSSETPRSSKGRHCKKFYTEEGCPNGDNCTFLPDEQSRKLESVAISLGPGCYNGAPTAGANTTAGVFSNWKTRICNKWELTGYCPFGNKCHFAHGDAELQRYGRGLMEMEARDWSTLAAELKQGGGLKPLGDSGASLIPSIPHSELYQRWMAVFQRVAQRAHQKWKDPDKIRWIYGDWIDEIE